MENTWTTTSDVGSAQALARHRAAPVARLDLRTAWLQGRALIGFLLYAALSSTAMPGLGQTTPASQVESIPEPVVCRVFGMPEYVYISFEVDGNLRKFFLDSANDKTYINAARWKVRDGSASIEVGLKIAGTKVAQLNGFTRGGPAMLRDVADVDGSLGCDFLDKIVLLVDSKQGMCAIWPSAKCTAATAMAWARLHPYWSSTVPDAFAGDWFEQPIYLGYNSYGFVPASIDGTAVSMAIDTGSEISGLRDQVIQKISHWALVPEEGEGYQGPVTLESQLIPSLRTSFLTRQIPVVKDLSPSFPGDGVLGLDCLTSGDWIMDRAHKELDFREYVPDVYNKVHTPKFDLYRKKDSTIIVLDQRLFKTTETSCDVLAINGLRPTSVLNLPTAFPLSHEDFNLFGAQLHRLLLKPFVVRVLDGGVEREFKIDVSHIER